MKKQQISENTNVEGLSDILTAYIVISFLIIQ